MNINDEIEHAHLVEERDCLVGLASEMLTTLSMAERHFDKIFLGIAPDSEGRFADRDEVVISIRKVIERAKEILNE